MRHVHSVKLSVTGLETISLRRFVKEESPCLMYVMPFLCAALRRQLRRSSAVSRSLHSPLCFFCPTKNTRGRFGFKSTCFLWDEG